MEITEQEDVFNAWIDIVKEHYPNLEITKELMDILSDTFAAGTVSQYLEGHEKATQKPVNARMH
jgi:hypothetical protein